MAHGTSNVYVVALPFLTELRVVRGAGEGQHQQRGTAVTVA